MREQHNGPIGNPDKENSLPETVSQNTEPMDVPSKLDASGVTESSGGQLAGHGTRSEALRGEHSQISHQPGRTTADWQREANQAGVEADISPDSDEHRQQGRNTYIPTANAQGQNLNRQINPVNSEYDTSVNTPARGTNGVDAMRGEHSQVDALANGGTTRDWKNMPSSAYKGVAGITDKDRNSGHMSTDWDGTAESEHPDAEREGADIRYRSSGGTVSQQQSLGTGE
jgi:hypothetical protein